MIRIAVTAVAATVFLACATAASAEAPQLNAFDGEAGETEAEAAVYFAPDVDGAAGTQFIGEISRGVSDRLALELQVTAYREGGDVKLGELSAQAFVQLAQLPAFGSLGLALEAGVAPEGEEVLAAYLYGAGDLGAWRTQFDLGVESGEEAELAYGWQAMRPASERLLLGFEGGGSGDRDGEHYAGPSASWRLSASSEAPQLQIGYLVGLNKRSPDLVKVGLGFSF